MPEGDFRPTGMGGQGISKLFYPEINMAMENFSLQIIAVAIFIMENK
jgi:hypothetical protein